MRIVVAGVGGSGKTTVGGPRSAAEFADRIAALL